MDVMIFSSAVDSVSHRDVDPHVAYCHHCLERGTAVVQSEESKMEGKAR